MRTAAVIWACACASVVVWMLLDSYLHERRQRTASPQEVKAAMAEVDAWTRKVVIEECLTPEQMDRLDRLAELEEDLDFDEFKREVNDPEYLQAFHHWVQIHSDANVDESRVTRLRDEWEGMEAA